MNRDQPKQLARPEPMSPPQPSQPRMSVQETLSREAQRAEEAKQRDKATGFLDRFFRLFADYSHHSGRSHVRKLGAVSGRTASAIVSEVRAFYARRPRPWRPAGSRSRIAQKVRFRYRKASGLSSND